MNIYSRYLFFVSILFFLAVGQGSAQNNLIVYSEPKEATDASAGPSEAKIIIITPNKDITVSHTMGTEKGVLAGREKRGEYRFELTHPFTEEEQEDGFLKTTVTVSNSQGSKSSVLTLKPGKCYMGRFEIPLKFSYIDESNQKSVYAEENRAKISFFSEVEDLTIKFNDLTVFQDGRPSPSLEYIQASVSKNTEHADQWVYNLIFDTSHPMAQSSAFKNPTFSVKSSFPEVLKIQLKEGNLLTVKRMYKFRVLLQLVETVIKEKEVYVSDYSQFLGNAEESEKNLKFSTAKGFYEQALAVVEQDKEAPVNAKETLTKKIAEMEELDKYDKQAKRAMLFVKEARKGGEAQINIVEDAFNQALTAYTNLNNLHPAPVYRDLIAKIEKALEAFDFIVIEGSVRDRKNNTQLVKDVDIYGVYSTTFNDRMEKKAQGFKVGSVDADGKFRVKIKKKAYGGLLFVPGDKSGYKKNGFVSLREQKHLKTTVYLYK